MRTLILFVDKLFSLFVFTLLAFASASLLALTVENEVNDDTEDECCCNVLDLDLTEIQHQATNTANEDSGYNEEVLVVTEVNILEHLQTAYCDEAVECDTNTTYYAVRNCVDECNQG